MSVLGVDIGGTKIAVGTVVNGKLVDTVDVKWDASAPRKEIISQITDIIDVLFTKKVSAIGIGVPGVIDAEKGYVHFVTNVPALSNTPLRAILSKKYICPIYMNNDAKCFALSQLSDNEKEKHIVGLILGTGVGAGVIINRQIYSGSQGVAGEVGCFYSHSGHNMESVLQGNWFTKNYDHTAKEFLTFATTGTLTQKKRAKIVFQTYGNNLGELLCDIILAYNPHRIILGGSISNAAKFFLPEAKESITRRIKELPIPTIDVSAHNYPGVLGAAKLASMRNK